MSEDPGPVLMANDAFMEALAEGLLEDVYGHVVLAYYSGNKLRVDDPKSLDEKILQIHSVLELGPSEHLPADMHKIFSEDLRGFCQSFNKMHLLASAGDTSPTSRAGISLRRQ